MSQRRPRRGGHQQSRRQADSVGMRYGHNVPNDQFLGSQSLRSRDVHNQTGAAQQSAAKRLPITTVIASQLPPTAWHAAIGEPSVADAICDRLIHRAHKLPLRERPCATRRRGAPEQGNHDERPSSKGCCRSTHSAIVAPGGSWTVALGRGSLWVAPDLWKTHTTRFPQGRWTHRTRPHARTRRTH
jgi:hypothetical protein